MRPSSQAINVDSHEPKQKRGTAARTLGSAFAEQGIEGIWRVAGLRGLGLFLRFFLKSGDAKKSLKIRRQRVASPATHGKPRQIIRFLVP
jgi:hypothetical protein